MRESAARLLVPVIHPVSMAPGQLVAACRAQLLAHHLRHQAAEADRRFPAEHRSSLARIAEQRIHFRRTEIAGIDAHDHLPALERRPALAGGALEISDFLRTPSLPGDPDSELARRGVDELAHALLHPGC